MLLTIIVAADLQQGIGKDNQLPWHLPQDMQFFKNTTWAMPVVMGRRTFESLGKPLLGRTNIVLSRQPDWQAEGIIKVDHLSAAIEAAQPLQTNETFIIGGATLYSLALPIVNRIYLTRVHTVINGADAFFPELAANEWTTMSERIFKADEKHAFDYTFTCLERKL